MIRLPGDTVACMGLVHAIRHRHPTLVETACRAHFSLSRLLPETNWAHFVRDVPTCLRCARIALTTYDLAHPAGA